MPGDWIHLGKRFFGSLVAEPLTDAERNELAEALTADEMALFEQQDTLDQRHGFASARHILMDGGDESMIRAAALHDIGKRHARLGVGGRVIASVLIKLRVPVSGRFRTYRDHGPIGAAELESVAAPPLAVDYARAHHGHRPSTIPLDRWRALSEADASTESRSRSTSAE